MSEGMAMACKHAEDLERVVNAAAPGLLQFTDKQASRRSGDGRWSAKEIVGHLIDSASNNHQRFVRARGKQDLIFETYRQDDWVALQGYNDAPWSDLVVLWLLFNRHLARVMALIPEPERTRLYAAHNFDRIAAYVHPGTEPACLEHLMADYVVHLERHVEQITRALGSPQEGAE